MEWKTQTSNSEFVKSDDGSSTRNKTLLLISYTDKVEKCKKKMHRKVNKSVWKLQTNSFP